MYWYWYYIFGNVMSNVMQYFLKVMFKALLDTNFWQIFSQIHLKKNSFPNFLNQHFFMFLLFNI